MSHFWNTQPSGCADTALKLQLFHAAPGHSGSQSLNIGCLPCWVQSRFRLRPWWKKHPNTRRRELLRVASCVTPAIPFSANGQGIGIFGDFRHKNLGIYVNFRTHPPCRWVCWLTALIFLCWLNLRLWLKLPRSKSSAGCFWSPKGCRSFFQHGCLVRNCSSTNSSVKNHLIPPWKFIIHPIPKADWHPRCSSDPLVHCPSPFHWRAQAWKHGNELDWLKVN